jgi:hypothetical protein
MNEKTDCKNLIIFQLLAAYWSNFVQKQQICLSLICPEYSVNRIFHFALERVCIHRCIKLRHRGIETI